jgi:hypothetical protein
VEMLVGIHQTTWHHICLTQSSSRWCMFTIW